MTRLLCCWAVLFLSILELQGQHISGIVKDVGTGQPLPFATVGFKGTSAGTITNAEGYFDLSIPESYGSYQLYISYVGYTSATLPVSYFDKDSKPILLKPAVITLSELVVRPLSPEEYIKRAVKNMKNALPDDPYNSNAYYREKFMENEGYLSFNEGVFKMYTPVYDGKSKTQYQLCLYETAENPQELQFMKDSHDKKEVRKKKKAEKKGEVYEDDGGNMIEASFGGPNEILKMQSGQNLETFLDSTYFVKFKYSFGNPVMYQDRELLCINFKSRGQVEHERGTGRILIDLKKNTFAGIEYTGEFVIPVVIEPVLLSLGLTISNPDLKKIIRMQFVDDMWYPDYSLMTVDLTLRKIHFFEKNEVSNFKIEQVLKLKDINTNQPQEIAQDKQYTDSKKPEEQIYNDYNWKWADFDRVLQ